MIIEKQTFYQTSKITLVQNLFQYKKGTHKK